MDNHSLVTADCRTHLKIAAVALLAGIVVVALGLRAHVMDTMPAKIETTGVVKAGKPATFTSRDESSIR